MKTLTWTSRISEKVAIQTLTNKYGIVITTETGQIVATYVERTNIIRYWMKQMYANMKLENDLYDVVKNYFVLRI